MSSHRELIEQAASATRQLMGELAPLYPELLRLGEAMSGALRRGGKVLWCGNGGSAAQCQHFAAEIVGRFRRERRGYASHALTTDSSVVTSLGNDFGFEAIFARQIEAICAPGDVVIGLSTSGNSANVLRGLDVARGLGAFTAAITGAGGGKLAQACDLLLAVPAVDTPRIQEAHLFIGHVLCELVDADLSGHAG